MAAPVEAVFPKAINYSRPLAYKFATTWIIALN
jgi:hypothetical protein